MFLNFAKNLNPKKIWVLIINFRRIWVWGYRIFRFASFSGDDGWMFQKFFFVFFWAGLFFSKLLSNFEGIYRCWWPRGIIICFFQNILSTNFLSILVISFPDLIIEFLIWLIPFFDLYIIFKPKIFGLFPWVFGGNPSKIINTF